MSDISQWFNSEVCRWRSAASLVWTILLTPVVTYTAITVSNISVLHPVSWFTDGLLLVFSPWTWPYVSFIALAIAVLFVQSSRQYSVVAHIASTRWEKLCSVLNMNSLYLTAVSAALCGVICWSYTRLLGLEYGSLSKYCQPESMDLCLNERHLFLVQYGIFTGLVIRISNGLTGNNLIVFPIVQQSKLFQFKSSVGSIVIRSLYTSLSRLKYFYILYYIILGGVAKNILKNNFGFQTSESDSPVNSITGLLDLMLFWHTLLTGAVITCLLSLGSRLYKLYHTELFEFHIETSVERYRNLCLPNALSCHGNNMVQFHGYQDLYNMSKHSLPRRQQVFSLTQLGGHPQNWLNISQECIGLLKSFVDEVTGYNTRLMSNGSLKQIGNENALNTAGSTNDSSVRERNVAVGSHDIKRVKSSPVKMVLDDLKKRRLVAYFLSEETDACSRKLFAKAQLYMWAVEALAYLVCASFREDKFGVVQKTLPDIICTLMDLQEQVEKHFRLVPSLVKRSDQEEDSDIGLRNALKVTLKAAIYKIVNIFGSHVRSIPLSNEHLRRLNHFLDYKE